MNAVTSDNTDLYLTLWDAVRPRLEEARDEMHRLIKARGYYVTKYLNEHNDEFIVGLKVAKTFKHEVNREIEIRVTCAGLHEDEKGANIKITALHRVNGEWMNLRLYDPYDGTDQAWTSDPAELIRRFEAGDLGSFVLDMLD